MSRTLKDRPYWVKANDKSIPRTPCHNHEDAGKPVYRYLPVKDENGKNVIETFTCEGIVGYRIYNMFEGFKTYTTWDELVADVSADQILFPPHYYIQRGDVERTRIKREKVLIGHQPTECTIDDVVPRPNSYRDNETVILCDHRVEGWAGGYYYCDHFPNKAERREYHGAARSNEKDSLGKLIKAVNAGYDYEDDDFCEDVFAQRVHRHRGWWC